jgi:hypothetical protein
MKIVIINNMHIFIFKMSKLHHVLKNFYKLNNKLGLDYNI